MFLDSDESSFRLQEGWKEVDQSSDKICFFESLRQIQEHHGLKINRKTFAEHRLLKDGDHRLIQIAKKIVIKLKDVKNQSTNLISYNYVIVYLFLCFYSLISPISLYRDTYSFDGNEILHI